MGWGFGALRRAIEVRSGEVIINSKAIRAAGVGGYNWSNLPWPYSSDSAFVFYFQDSNVYPSGYDNRWVGDPLRCLAN